MKVNHKKAIVRVLETQHSDTVTIYTGEYSIEVTHESLKEPLVLGPFQTAVIPYGSSARLLVDEP